MPTASQAAHGQTATDQQTTQEQLNLLNKAEHTMVSNTQKE